VFTHPGRTGIKPVYLLPVIHLQSRQELQTKVNMSDDTHFFQPLNSLPVRLQSFIWLRYTQQHLNMSHYAGLRGLPYSPQH